MISVPLPSSTLSAVAFWAISISLMLAEHFANWGSSGDLARWSLLVALGAVCCTLAAVINHARRVVLDVMSWEHKGIRAELDATVTPIRAAR